MRAGPSETGCRISFQTTRRCVGLRIHVVSGSGKGGGMTLSGENQEGERE
jgi:hypothetical protein